MTEMERQVPREEDIPLILQDISTAANEAGVKIFQIKPMKEERESVLKTATGVYYRVPILLEAQAGYHPFGKFLNILENSEIFMSINRLEIIPTAKDYQHHNINLMINAFIFKEKR
jgi:Tfp pilus assembly protein PilO